MAPLEREIHAFCNARWPGRSIGGRMRKLGEEMGELAEALMTYEAKPGGDRTDKVQAEAADCAIVLTDLLAMIGISLQMAMSHKMEENRRRTPKEAAQIACRMLVKAYDTSKESESVDWNDIDAAYMAALAALGETR